jgi:hypothetical protein
MPDEAPFPAYKDIDLHLIFEEGSPALPSASVFMNILEIPYQGLMLEGGLKSLQEYQSAEVVLADPEIAHHFTKEITMNNHIKIAGFCGIIGGMVWFFQTLVTEVLFPQLAQPGTLSYTINGLVATVALALLLISFLGIAWSGGLVGWFGRITFGIAALGYGLMVVGGGLTLIGAGPLSDPPYNVSLIYLLGRLITVIFTLLTGVAVLTARRWQGWTKFAPLLLGLWPIIGEILPAIMTGDRPSQLLNGAWGLFGALLGLAILAQRWPTRVGEFVAVDLSTHSAPK